MGTATRGSLMHRTAFMARLAALPILALGCGRAPAGTEADLRGALAHYDSAWQAKDSAAVAAILRSDYLYFTSTGGLSDRARSLAFLRDTSYTLTRSERSEVQLTIAGGIARVASRWQGDGSYQGEVVRDDQTCGQTWVWHAGRWGLMTEHCVERR